jgi:hypothetical protein
MFPVREVEAVRPCFFEQLPQRHRAGGELCVPVPALQPRQQQQVIHDALHALLTLPDAVERLFIFLRGARAVERRLDGAADGGEGIPQLVCGVVSKLPFVLNGVAHAAHQSIQPAHDRLQFQGSARQGKWIAAITHGRAFADLPRQ